MRKLVALALVALGFAAGCGDDDDDGGNGGGTLSGRIRGQSFTPTEIVFAGPQSVNACSYPPVTYGNSAVVIGFSATPGVCALVSAPCTGRRGFDFVAGVVAHAQLGAGDAPPLEPGTFTVYEDIVAALGGLVSGPVSASIFEAQRTDAATCGRDPDPPTAAGTITLDRIDAGSVTGSIDVTFADGQGGFLRGPFSASPCAQPTLDFCFPAVGFCADGGAAGTPTTCP